MTKIRIQLLLSLLLGIVAAVCMYWIYASFDINRWDYLAWDPAAHGWDGMRLSLDIRKFDMFRLLAHTNSLVLWPPLHSYLQIPYFLIGGLDFHSSILCSLTFLTLMPVVLTWFYQQMEVSWPGWLSLMGFTMTSPMILGYGSMPMLEIFGAVLTAYSAALFLRKSVWFPLSLTLLFFLKYNYCLYVMLPVLAIHISGGVVTRFWQWIRPMKMLLVLYAIFAIFALLILITGGFDIGTVSMRGIGNPAYALFLITWILLFWKKQHLVLWRTIRGTGWEWFLIPVGLWLLIPVPNRIKTILSFAISKPLGGQPPTSLDYYSYYLEKLPLYFADQWIAWLSICLLIVITVVYRKKREILFTGYLFLLPFLLMTINQNKQERYLLTFLPSIWILVAYGISRIRSNILRFVFAVAVCVTLTVSLHVDVVRAIVRWQFAPLGIRAPIRFIAERIGAVEEIRVLGVTNELNPAMIQYHAGRQSGFSVDQHFRWQIESNPQRDLHILCIDCESDGKLLRTRTFRNGMVVRHYFLDTPDAAPYNPNQ